MLGPGWVAFSTDGAPLNISLEMESTCIDKMVPISMAALGKDNMLLSLARAGRMHLGLVMYGGVGGPLRIPCSESKEVVQYREQDLRQNLHVSVGGFKETKKVLAVSSQMTTLHRRSDQTLQQEYTAFKRSLPSKAVRAYYKIQTSQIKIIFVFVRSSSGPALGSSPLVSCWIWKKLTAWSVKRDKWLGVTLPSNEINGGGGNLQDLVTS